jgi:hypothetical protein
MKIDKIEIDEAQNAGLGGAIDYMREGRAKAVKTFINNRGAFISIILIILFILVFTTEISFSSAMEIRALSLVIIAFMFCSYSMYVNCADSGTKAGKNTKGYKAAQSEYDTVKASIVNTNRQHELGDFCRHYVNKELETTKKDILDGASVPYAEYINRWANADKKTVKSSDSLSNRARQAILCANAVKPIKLTPEMIMRCGKRHTRRAPLGVHPDTVKSLRYSAKLLTTIATSLFACMLSLGVISNPSWATFAELFGRLILVLLSGFAGYQMGYESITIDTVDYIQSQTELLKQFEMYLAKR